MRSAYNKVMGNGINRRRIAKLTRSWSAPALCKRLPNTISATQTHGSDASLRRTMYKVEFRVPLRRNLEAPDLSRSGFAGGSLV